MFERPEGGDRAVLVHMDFRSPEEREALDEFRQLVLSAGVTPVGEVVTTRSAPDARLFIGSGKAEEVGALLHETGCTLVLFNHALAPAQERNLERLLQARVLDRTELILDIFAQRARSFEGKLQVELAQLRHLSTRLVRGWTHLERQKGGIGLRGPGEKQLETDRRLLGQRVRQISQRLRRVSIQRGMRRHSRRKADLPVVSLVGYTNAGKSTIFNCLTRAGVLVADQLFATLDPTLRRLDLGRGQAAILADTVGFIRHLPHDLVAAFRATLEETREADLLLHVIDAGDPERRAKVEQVNEVLREIGAAQVAQLEVYNKVDLLPPEERSELERDAEGRPDRVWVSAATDGRLEVLRRALSERLAGARVRRWLRLRPSAGRLRARLFEMGVVVVEELHGEEWRIEVEMAAAELDALLRREGIHAESVAGVAQAT